MIERVESLAFPQAEATSVTVHEERSYLSSEEVEILTRAKAGDHQALRHLYNTYQGQVRGHLYRLLGSDPDVDDMVQTVFSRAFNALDRFQANSTIGTWLYRITANTTHNLLRQRFRRERFKGALQWFNDGRDAHLERSRAEVRDEAQRLLDKVRPDLRHVFVLYHYEGLTLQEIGQVLDKPVSTVGDRLTRARNKLKELATS